MSTLDQQSAVVLWAGFNSRTVTINNVTAGASIIVKVNLLNFDVGTFTLGCSSVNDGSAYLKADSSVGGASGGYVTEEVWYLHNASAGTHSIVVTSNRATNNNFGQIMAHSVIGLQNAAPDFTKPNAANSATLTTGNSAAPSQSGMWLVAALGVTTNLATPTWTHPATGFTQLLYDPATAHGPGEFDYQHITSTSAQVASWGTNSAGAEYFASLLVGFKDVVAGGAPTITSVTQSGQPAGTIQQGASVTITGANLGANTGSAAVTLIDGGNSSLTASCSATAWGSTSVVVNVNSGNVRNGALTLRLTTSGGLQVSFGVTLIPPTGTSYGTFGTMRALTFDAKNAPSRLYDSPDIGSGEQWEMTTSAGAGAVTVYQDGNAGVPVAITQIAFRHHNGAQWSAVTHWDMRGLFPLNTLTIPSQVGVNGVALSWDFSPYFAVPDSSTLPLTYTISSGAQPTGLPTIDSATGKIIGTPSATGTFSGIVLRATNAQGSYVEAPAFPATIAASPDVTFSGPIPNFPNLLANNVGTNPIDVAGYFGNATTYTVTSGSLPPGMTLTGSVITGVPTGAGITAGQSADYTIVITGSNAVPSTFPSNSFTLTVSNPAVVVPTAPTLLAVYSGQLASHRADPSQLFPATPKNYAYLTGQNSFECADNCSVGALDAVSTAYRYFRIPSNARVTDLQVRHDGNPGALYSAGVMRIDGLEPVSGAAGVFFPATSFSTARSTLTSLYQPNVAGSIPAVQDMSKRIWELLGYTKDPSAVYEVVLKCVSAGNTAANIALRLTYVS